MEIDQFNTLSMQQINERTNTKIEQYSFLTKLLMGDLREQSLRKYNGAVINVGTTKTLAKKSMQFKDKKEENQYAVYDATTTYQTTMATLMVQQGFTNIDFVSDSPKQISFFHNNLKYLGIKVTPGTHVDQVARSLVMKYTDR